MIEVNLLPPELRKKEPKFMLAIPKETLYFVGGVVIAILVLMHIILISNLIVKKAKNSNLNRKKQQILPYREKLDGIEDEQGRIYDKIRSIDKLTKKGRINWTRKLNIISDALPQGVWLRRIEFTGAELIIEGSSVSLKNQEVILINNFTTALKNNEDFSSDFQNIELGSIKRRPIKDIEVADFVLTTKLKEK
ncbi:MAG: PilN domain-containing protein [Candidatus Omnitrophota bacterium]